MFLSYCSLLYRDLNGWRHTFQKYSHDAWKGYNHCNTSMHRSCTDAQTGTGHTVTLVHSNPSEIFHRVPVIQSLQSFNSRICKNDIFPLSIMGICVFSGQIYHSVPVFSCFPGFLGCLYFYTYNICWGLLLKYTITSNLVFFIFYSDSKSLLSSLCIPTF